MKGRESGDDHGELHKSARRARYTLFAMGGVALAAAAISLLVMYRAGVTEQRRRLREYARGQAHLIDAVARFDAIESRDANPSGAWVATLAQVADGFSRGHDAATGVGLFVIGRAPTGPVVHVRNGELLAPNSEALPTELPIDLAELALAGRRGGRELRPPGAARWLVVFEPVPALEMAVVARLDLAVIGRPLEQAAWVSGVASLVLIGLGVSLVRQTNVRAVQRLSSELQRRRVAEEALARHGQLLEETVLRRTMELEQAQAELLEQTRLATIGELTAKVSHELKNPLGTLRTTLHTLRQGTGDAPELARSWERAERNIERCNRIIEELLTYTRRQPPSVARVDLKGLIREVLEDYQAPESVRIETDLDDGLELLADPEDLRRILINLLNNAVAAIPVADQEDPILVTLNHDGECVCLVVEDHGTGISPDLLERVFEPLFSTRGFGVGLGLPIVRELAERNGGAVKLISEPNRGTRAIVRFSRDAEPSA